MKQLIQNWYTVTDLKKVQMLQLKTNTKLNWVTMTMTAKIAEFSSKSQRQRDGNYDENVSDENNNGQNATHIRGDSTSQKQQIWY